MIATERTVLALPKSDLELLVNEWLADLQVARRTPKTRRGYEQTLRLFVQRTGVRTLEQFTDKAVKSYLIEISEGNYPGMRGSSGGATQHRAWRELKAFVSWGIQLENPPAFHSSLIDKRPGVRQWFRVPEPTVDEEEIEVFTPKQLAIIEQAAKRYQGTGRITASAIDRRYLLFGHTLLGTGMRIDEALRLEIVDLEENPYARPENDDAAGFLRVRKSKTHKPRPVPVSDKLYRDLIRYIGRERPKTSSQVLFVDQHGRPMQQHSPQQFFDGLSTRTGIHVHAHKFRHTFATDFLREHPGDIERLRAIMGHSDYKMIKRYVHLNLQMLGAGWNAGAPY